MDKHTGVVVGFLLLQLSGTLAQVIEGPADTPSIIGEKITLECSITDPGDLYEWVDMRETLSRQIYAQGDPGTIDPSKYVMDGTNLQVLDTMLYDGGEYGCKHYDDNSFSTADVVVLGTPSFVMPELMEGLTVLISCSAQYGGPIPGDIDDDVKPTLRLYVDGSVQGFIANMTVEGHPGYEGSFQPSVLQLSGYIIPTSNLHERNISCELSTSQPSKSVAVHQLLDVQYAVRDIEVSPQKESYYVGDIINCTAEGNPLPDFMWRPESTTGPRDVGHAALEVLSDMMGHNEWECIATNNVMGTHTDTVMFTFEVVSGSDPESDGGGSIHRQVVNTALLSAILLVPAVMWKT